MSKIIKILSVIILLISSSSFAIYTPGNIKALDSISTALVPPEQSGDSSYWNVTGDIKLFHFSQGNGEKVLIVHGGPAYPYTEPIPALDRLAKNYEFIYYDQRGCGNSTRPIETFETNNFMANFMPLEKQLGLGEQIADIERIRRILGEDKLIIIGHSFGAFIASMYAAEFPEHVKALILIAPANILKFPADDGGLFEQIKPLLTDSMKTEFNNYLSRYLDYANIWTKTEKELSILNAEFVKYYLEASKAKGIEISSEIDLSSIGGWAQHGIYLSMGMQYDHSGFLKNINSPVLIIHGDNDLQTETASRSYQLAIPKSQFAIIKNASHFLFYDQPEEFGKVVSDFLEKLE